MKIACDSCGAKYTIADEKVSGKTVKIRCKKCGATMVIDGQSAAAAPASQGPAPSVEAANGWMLHVGEGDQESLTVDQVVERYRDGRIDGSAYVWREGMADWKLLRDVPELFAVCVSAVGAAAPPASASRPVESARRASAPPPAMPADSAAIGDEESTVARDVPSPKAAATASATPAASARGPLADLVAASATPSSAPQAPSALTGQRNDNSVLFSLASLSKNGPAAPAAPGSDASGLIDMRALAAIAPKPAASSAPKVDEIMNLSSGGLFGGGAVSPVMTQTYQAVQAPPGAGAPASGGVSSKTLGMAIGGGAFVAILIAGGAFFAMRKAPEAPQAPAAAVVPASPAPAVADAPKPVEPVPAAAPAAPAVAVPAAAKAPEPAKAVTEAPKAPAAAKAAPASKGGVSSTAAAAALFGPGGVASKPAPAPVPVAPSKPASLESAMSAAATKSAPAAAPKAAAPAAAASGPAFDRGAAAAELRRIAEGVSACRKANGPSGDGHVSITFRNDGTVEQVEVDRPPYQGSAVGACVASKFKLARIPAFGGTVPPVGKSFSID